MTSSTTRPFGEIAGVDVFRAIVILITQRGTDKAHGRLLTRNSTAAPSCSIY